MRARTYLFEYECSEYVYVYSYAYVKNDWPSERSQVNVTTGLAQVWLERNGPRLLFSRISRDWWEAPFVCRSRGHSALSGSPTCAKFLLHRCSVRIPVPWTKTERCVRCRRSSATGTQKTSCEDCWLSTPSGACIRCTPSREQRSSKGSISTRCAACG